MRYVTVVTAFGAPQLVTPSTPEKFEKDRKTLTNLGQVLTMNEKLAFGYTNNEGRAVCHYLLPFQERVRETKNENPG